MSTPASSADPVLYDRPSLHVGRVTLNRPAKRNAIDRATAALLEAIVQQSEADPEVRVVVLASADPRAFCAGADLGAVAAGEARGITTAAGGFAGFVYALRAKPWIAVVEGLAVGGGFEICLACELVVASEDARFGLPEVKRGLMAAAGGVHRVGALLPRNLAHELLMTGEPIAAESLHRWGLVNRLTPPGEAMAAALALAETIAANAPLAVQASLAAARASAAQPDGAGRDIAAQGLAALRRSEDYQEGVRAFVEKRTPVWKGR